jgi:hypothetical protein
LVGYERWWDRRPGVYLATREGLSVGEVDLPLPRVDVRTYWHTLAAVDLAIELDAAGWQVASEREVRAVDHGASDPGELTYCPTTGRGADGLRLHVPDLAVAGGSGRPVADEVELTAKRLRRLRQIAQSYVRARHLAGVVYVTPYPQIAHAVQRVARELDASELIVAWQWRPREGRR